jgi:hypothetical protein
VAPRRPLGGLRVDLVSEQPPSTPSLRTATARDLGVTRGELAGPGWEAPYRGVVRPAGPPLQVAPRQRLYDVAELLPPGAAIGGWGAAFLLGADELDGRGRSGTALEPVPVVLPPPLLVRRRAGLVRWRSALHDGDVVDVQGIACTSPARTGFDLVRTRDLRAGVVCLDVLGRQVGLEPADVLAYAHRHRRWRGRPRVAPAVALADPRARSTGETRLRLVWRLDAGLPAPEVNPSVLDVCDGRLLGQADLLDPTSGLVGEYDGAGHRDEGQHALDNAREEWLEDAGLVVVRASAPDLWSENARRTVLRLVTGHRRAQRRDRDQDRWTWRPMRWPHPDDRAAAT